MWLSGGSNASGEVPSDDDFAEHSRWKLHWRPGMPKLAGLWMLKLGRLWTLKMDFRVLGLLVSPRTPVEPFVYIYIYIYICIYSKSSTEDLPNLTKCRDCRNPSASKVPQASASLDASGASNGHARQNRRRTALRRSHWSRRRATIDDSGSPKTSKIVVFPR